MLLGRGETRFVITISIQTVTDEACCGHKCGFQICSCLKFYWTFSGRNLKTSRVAFSPSTHIAVYSGLCWICCLQSPIRFDVHSWRANWSTHDLRTVYTTTLLKILEGSHQKARPTRYSFVTKLSVMPYGYGWTILVFRQYYSKHTLHLARDKVILIWVENSWSSTIQFCST
jgi:hypothetical protein